MQTIILQIPSMHCNHCTNKIQTFLSEVCGVQEITFDLSNKEVKISFCPPVTQEKIIEAIEECGFEIQ